MFRNKIFISSVFVLLVVAAVHLLASIYDLYYYIWWLDTPMHFLGGLWLSLLFFWVFMALPIFSRLEFFARFFTKRGVFLSIIVALLVGAGWELFELLIGIMKPSEIGYLFDTSKDILMDTLGACLGAVISVGLFRYNKANF